MYEVMVKYIVYICENFMNCIDFLFVMIFIMYNIVIYYEINIGKFFMFGFKIVFILQYKLFYDFIFRNKYSQGVLEYLIVFIVKMILKKN